MSASVLATGRAFSSQRAREISSRAGCRQAARARARIQQNEEGGSGGGVVEAIVILIVLYSLLGDGIIAIAGPRVVHTRFRKSPVTDLQL